MLEEGREMGSRGILTATVLALLPAAFAAGEEPWRQKWQDDAYAEARRAFTDKVFDDLCLPGEDTVPLKTVMSCFFSDDPTPRQVRRILDYDPTEDGRIDRDEMYHGFTAFVFFQVYRRMDLDGDGDGALSLREYALEIPDDTGRRDEEGYLPQQRRYFEQADLNGDETVTREEIIQQFSESYLQSFGGYFLGYKLEPADANHDHILTVEELAAVLGQETVTADVEALAEAWNIRDGEISTHILNGRFGRMTPAEQVAVAMIVGPFWQEHRNKKEEAAQ